MDADEQLGAQLAGLQDGASMAWRELAITGWALQQKGREGAPWWAKSKQPSIQMRSSAMGTSSCGSTGHWPGCGTYSVVSV